jgi:hypothetical protein
MVLQEFPQSYMKFDTAEIVLPRILKAANEKSGWECWRGFAALWMRSC